MPMAVAYMRVSTQEQARSGISLDNQRDRLAAYCSSMQLQVIEFIEDRGVSGSKLLDSRPGGKRLIQILDTGLATHVVALKLDRLFRSTEDALDRTTQWERNGVTLHLTDMGGQNLNTASAMGKMMLTLMASFAEFERNLISERTAAALNHQKCKGKVYNHAPYGFRKEGKELMPDEEEQRILKHIFAWRHEGDSLQVIARKLNDLGVPSKRGGKWHPATLAHMVNNDLYRQADNLVPWPPGGKRQDETASAEAKLMRNFLFGERESSQRETE